MVQHPSTQPRQLGRDASAFSSDSEDSQAHEDMRAFLQRRVGALGRLLAGMFFVWRLISSFALNDAPSRAYLPWQAITVVAFAAMWLACRGRPRSARVRAIMMPSSARRTLLYSALFFVPFVVSVGRSSTRSGGSPPLASRPPPRR